MNKERSEQASFLGWGFGLLIAGCLIFANQLGWIKNFDWILPAAFLGMAVNYLYRGFTWK